ILITGITGFVGGHLTEALVPKGHALIGVCRQGAWPASLAHLAGKAELHQSEVADTNPVEGIFNRLRPDWVIHLPGSANPGRSYHEPDLCWSDNLTATRSLYDAIARTGQKPRILFVSTGLIYGEPDEPGGACDERTTLKPATPYAASKAAADLLSY